MIAIDDHFFSHPHEAAALDELLKTLNFKDHIEEHYINFKEKKRQPDLLGKTVRVTEKQFPDVYRIARSIGERTCVTVPELYVYEDFYYSVESKGMQTPWIELSATVMNDFTPKEIEFMLAREMYKIHFHHTYYHTLLQESLEMMEKGLIPLSNGVAEDISRAVYYRWTRLSQYGADSFGYAVTADLQAGVRSILKCVLNSVFMAEHTDLVEYIQQAEKINELHDEVHESAKSDELYPYGPFRVKHLLAYASSEKAMNAVSRIHV